MLVAGFQIGASVGVMLLLSLAFGWPTGLAVLLGFVVALSSTAVAIKILDGIGELRSRSGRITVAVLIALFAPITQAGWNPARDFGPRIVAYFAGWEDIAIPGPRDGFWIYIIGPLIGGPIGAALYDFVLRPALPKESD